MENLTNDTPPKKGFRTPLVRYVFHPPRVSALCFSCTKIHERADQKLSWRGPKVFGRARSLVRFPPPIPYYVLHPPISRPKTVSMLFAHISVHVFALYAVVRAPKRKPNVGTLHAGKAAQRMPGCWRWAAAAASAFPCCSCSSAAAAAAAELGIVVTSPQRAAALASQSVSLRKDWWKRQPRRCCPNAFAVDWIQKQARRVSSCLDQSVPV